MFLLSSYCLLLLFTDLAGDFGVLRQVLRLVDFDPVGYLGEDVVARRGVSLSLQMHIQTCHVRLAFAEKLCFVLNGAIGVETSLKAQIIEEREGLAAKPPDIVAFDLDLCHTI